MLSKWLQNLRLVSLKIRVMIGLDKPLIFERYVFRFLYDNMFGGEDLEGATLESVYREIKLLRRDVDSLKKMLVSEVEPEQDEIHAVRAGRREFKDKKYVEWSKVKEQN